MSAAAIRANDHPKPQRASNQSLNTQEFGVDGLRVSSGELLSSNSRCGGGCADLPYVFCGRFGVSKAKRL